MALRRQIIDLVRAYLLDYPDQVGGIGQVTVMQRHAHTRFVRVLVEMIYSISIERGGTTLDTMHFIVFSQKQLGQIRAVLTGNSSNQGRLTHYVTPQIIWAQNSRPLLARILDSISCNSNRTELSLTARVQTLFRNLSR